MASDHQTGIHYDSSKHGCVQATGRGARRSDTKKPGEYKEGQPRTSRRIMAIDEISWDLVRTSLRGLKRLLTLLTLLLNLQPALLFGALPLRPVGRQLQRCRTSFALGPSCPHEIEAQPAEADRIPDTKPVP